jgi:UDP:flavonoid glycosyltransferase YjiC (YdhE family)
VPVIRHLLAQNHKVVIAADGPPLQFLQGYFPGLEFIRFPGARIIYPSGNNMVMKMMLQSPSILFNIYRENQQLKKIIRETGADVVISDNRFGLWSKQAYSVYITHQLMIKAPVQWAWAEPLLHRMHGWFIRQYDECWIPDLPGEMNLSGDLGHKYPIPPHGNFIGFLSRFEKPVNQENPRGQEMAPDILVLLSGPEPQRSILESKVLDEISLHRGLHVVLLQGLPGENKQRYPFPGVAVLSHLPDDELARLICSARLIICRPGYSTLMDLAALGNNAVLVPTPGQTEQEYLAKKLAATGTFYSIEQKDFNFTDALQGGRGLASSPDFMNDSSLLAKQIAGLVEKVRAR